jgi:membrane-bound lytic murein transglycosylase B
MRFFICLTAIFIIAKPLFANEKLTEYISKRFNLPSKYVANSLEKAKIDNAVLEKISNPSEEKDWEEYKKIFFNPQKIKKGKRFYKRYKKILLKAEKKYRVPSPIIAAIIGIESDFGKYRPRYNALNSLYTLATEFDRRSAYFTDELGSFLNYTYKYRIAPSDILSSYAGAIGIPQFMPSNILKYAVDFNGDGRIDLENSIADAIGSVANYLNKNGWKSGEATAVMVKNADRQQDNFVKVQTLRKKGVIFPFNIKKGEVKIVKFDVSYWATFKNFDVLKKYNPSDNYALSVLLLSKELR